MSGHSKWAKLKRSKGIIDVKKGSVLSRISKDIMNAVRIGGSPEPNFNPMLRVVLEKAKAANMTNERIDRAIKKGGGVVDASEAKLFENTYEVYGPGGAAILIDTESDNPNRTVTDVKTILGHAGAKLANEGSISWQFKEIGQIILKVHDSSKINGLEEKILGIDGIEDISSDEDEIIVLSNRNNFRKVLEEINNLKDNSFDLAESKLIKKSSEVIDITEEEENSLVELIEKLEDVPETVNIWTNVRDYE